MARAIQKLLVLGQARRAGTGSALIGTLEDMAAKIGRPLLTLDTRTGSGADALYAKLAWSVVGQVPGYALDPDGTAATCTFYWKRLA